MTGGPIAQWRKVARVARAGGWVVLSLAFTSATVVDLVREIVAGPALSDERVRRRLAVALAADDPAPAGPAAHEPPARDCLRLTGGGHLCRQPINHAGPCTPGRPA